MAEHFYLSESEQEFNIATGYWKKWHRVEAEKAELEARIEQLIKAINTFLQWEYPNGTDHPADWQAHLLRQAALSGEYLKKEGEGDG